jgi:hypothetical protein
MMPFRITVKESDTHLFIEAASLIQKG